MKTLVNSVASYFLFPISFSVALLVIFYNVPYDFYLSLFALPLVVLSIVLLARFFVPMKLEIVRSFELIVHEKRYKVVIFVFCCIVFVSGPIDIYQNGFKLLDPASYAEFNGVGRYVRHISIMCWTLVPIAFIFTRKIKFRLLFVGYALLFPIIILDRNRLFTSSYSIALCLIMAPSLPSHEKSVVASKKNRHLFVLFFILFLIFSGLGLFRSGADAFLVESSGDVLSDGALPLRDIFYYLPSLFQQVVLYITTPIFNFATIFYYDFRNEEFLLSQLAPFGRDVFDAYPYAPVMIPRFNVGTEFYPFLLYGGLPLVVACVILMACSFLVAGFLVKKRPNIFTFLIFIKVSYSVVFMGFAPQFYLLLNFAFVVLMVVLWLGALLLNKSKARAEFGGRVECD